MLIFCDLSKFFDWLQCCKLLLNNCTLVEYCDEDVNGAAGDGKGLEEKLGMS